MCSAHVTRRTHYTSVMLSLLVRYIDDMPCSRCVLRQTMLCYVTCVRCIEDTRYSLVLYWFLLHHIHIYIYIYYIQSWQKA